MKTIMSLVSILLVLLVMPVRSQTIPPPAQTGIAEFECGQTFVDTRNNMSYPTTQIGIQCWFAKNLLIGTKLNNTQMQTNNSVIEYYCPNNDAAKCDVYGGQYQWGELMNYATTAGSQGICPTGWHIPTFEEVYVLINTVGELQEGRWYGDSTAGAALKEAGYAHWAKEVAYSSRQPTYDYYGGRLSRGEHPTWWKSTNSSGFTWLPNGYVTSRGTGLTGRVAYLATSSKKPCSVLPGLKHYTDPTPYLVYFSTMNTQPFVLPGIGYEYRESMGVRCLKD